MFGSRNRKLTIDHELFERLGRAAQIAGYSSTEEFILDLLEKAAPASSATDSEEAVRRRLKGLGYLE